MLPLGSLPEGWTALAGHLSMRVRGLGAGVVGAAKANVRSPESIAKVFMMVKCERLNLETMTPQLEIKPNT